MIYQCDGLHQAHMKLCSTRLATLNRLSALSPAMTVRRGKDRRLKIRSEIVPIPSGFVSYARFDVGCGKKVFKAQRFCRREEPKGTSLVLPEAAFGCRPKNGRSDGVQWPAPF